MDKDQYCVHNIQIYKYLKENLIKYFFLNVGHGGILFSSKSVPHQAYPKYGKAAFRVLVYTGKTYKCTTQADPLRTTWQKEYASCWVPPNSTE